MYRHRLLARLNIQFTSVAPDIDEGPHDGEAPQALAQRLCVEKALAVSARNPQALIIGSDQVAATAGHLLGKPITARRAQEQLRLSSGNTVYFYTGVALAHGDRVLNVQCVETEVKFRTLSDTQIADYIKREEPLDCAGSFRWEGLGICLFRSLRSDDPTALEGLPLIALSEMLQKSGIKLL